MSISRARRTYKPAVKKSRYREASNSERGLVAVLDEVRKRLKVLRRKAKIQKEDDDPCLIFFHLAIENPKLGQAIRKQMEKDRRFPERFRNPPILKKPLLVTPTHGAYYGAMAWLVAAEMQQMRHEFGPIENAKRNGDILGTYCFELGLILGELEARVKINSTPGRKRKRGPVYEWARESWTRLKHELKREPTGLQIWFCMKDQKRPGVRWREKRTASGDRKYSVHWPAKYGRKGEMAFSSFCNYLKKWKKEWRKAFTVSAVTVKR